MENRTIKFRAWDKTSNRIINVVEIHFGSDGLDIVVWDGEQIAYVLHPNQYILMQYTGLKDFNGREIYEDDIIKTEYGDIVPIRFINGVFEGFFNENNDTNFVRVDFIDIDYGLECEVIGNIHQHPHLLKKG